ncbi:MAG: hypothetical protein ABWZ66_00785 [Pyrinomonadaceae bacterium]
MIDFKRYFPPITDIEVIARRFSIRDLERLRRDYGGRDWRKLKGRALVELKDGSTKYAELHWYECHSIGKREIKIKRLLD